MYTRTCYWLSTEHRRALWDCVHLINDYYCPFLGRKKLHISFHLFLFLAPPYPLQYSCLKNPTDRGAWWVIVHGVEKNWTRLKLLSMHSLYELPWWLSGKESTCQCRRCKFDPWVGKISWRRKWQATPVFLPRKSHGQRSLAGYSQSMDRKVSDMTEHTDTRDQLYVLPENRHLPGLLRTSPV